MPEAPLSATKTPKRVLVVDDDADSADLLKYLLEMNGYDVLVADTAEQALGIVDGASVYAAVIDIGLPTMDGFELAVRLRGLPRTANCRLLALSGYGPADVSERRNESAFDAHLVKPVNIPKLLSALSAPEGSL